MTTTTYDAVIVGARCAGSPTAMLLARSGYRVLLVDRATFPSDTISTHFLTPLGVDSLRRWGLLDRLLATNCPKLGAPRMTINGELMSIAGPDPAEFGLAPRRTVLDKLLLDAAREAGAEIREGVSVREITRDGDRVTGIRARSADGSDIVADAKIVVGADGRSSMVAEAVAAERYEVRPGGTCGFYSYWKTETPIAEAELHIKNKRAMFVFPTNDGETCIGSEWRMDEFAAFKQDVEGNILAVIDTASDIGPRLRAGTRTDKLFGLSNLESYHRKPHGPGWALVGDAGYHVDPVTGQGITNAFRDAELLATAIDDGFSGRAPLEESLANYQQQRDTLGKLMYEVTDQLASLDPSPGLLAMMAQGAPAPA